DSGLTTSFSFDTAIKEDITLYAKWTETAVIQAGSISYATTSVSKTTGSTAFTNELTKTGDGTVTYSSSDENVATVNASTGEVTIEGTGTATITATVTDSASYTYATKTASYTVKVLSETLLTTITGTGNNGAATSENISYSTGDVATLTFSGEVLYASVWGWWGYDITLTVTPADGYTITKCIFYDNEDNNATDSEAPFVAETSGDQKMPKVNGSYIYPYSDSTAVKKIEVYGYITNPAEQQTALYTVTLTGGANATISGGNITQEGLSEAMETVTFTANDGYYFEDFTDITSNGITATRTSDSVVTVSGTPTGNASITIPDATEQQATTYSITLTYQYTDFTFVMEYQEGDKWNDMATKYPDYIKINSSYVEFQSYGQICDKATGNKVSPTDEIDPNKTYEIQ
ncbi:MAG: Ig-like domain-containing protein, partial [Treponema sp.]|nr:Ig-like domain-containing protein [Treponema sp.]